MKDESVLVAGGGIAGLAVARALRSRGIRAAMSERRAPAAAPDPAINLAGNGVAAFARLGLRNEFEKVGRPTHRREYRSVRSELYFEVDEDEFRARMLSRGACADPPCKTCAGGPHRRRRACQAPVWAQGAALAVEDALVLADVLADGDWDTAGIRYQQCRQGRVQHVPTMTDQFSKVLALPPEIRDSVCPSPARWPTAMCSDRFAKSRERGPASCVQT
jgi:2-polyprenyl-6-methoxyphenol hydroxylase-like FAD-dependent oxidoreductase